MANSLYIKKSLIIGIAGILLAGQLFLLSAHQWIHVYNHADCAHDQPFKNKSNSNECAACLALHSALPVARMVTNITVTRFTEKIWIHSITSSQAETKKTKSIRAPPNLKNSTILVIN